MQRQSFGTDDFVSRAVEKYSDMVRRICFMYLKNHFDTEDVFQEVFLKLLQKAPEFESEEHEKAWLCKVTFNKCKDLTGSFWRKRVDSIEDTEITFETPKESGIINAVLILPHKYKQIIYLHYYEGYTVPEISAFLQKNENTVYTMLRKAKELLKNQIKEDIDFE